MPSPGTFVLHAHVVPALPAGAYTVRTEQTITAPGASIDALDSHLEITAPRFVLPASEILSTFPPNQSEGSYATRLPQIVLKRRTLPWERAIAPASPSAPPTPWLALVVLAEAEAELLLNRPIAQCVTSGVTLEGRSDAETANAVRVTSRVVRDVFPALADLPLLAHVREVDVSDTERGDDDGWVAVVIANRLPQAGVTYRACLVSLEGQLGELPVDPPQAPSFDTALVYPDAVADVSPFLRPTARASSNRGRRDAWSEAPRVAGTSAATSGANVALPSLAAAMHARDLAVLHPAERLLTFPLLAHFTFTCAGDRDFRAIASSLHVGMIGTAAPPPPITPGKPPPPAHRAPPETLATGHVGLGATTREGEARRAWYRGPLAPHPTERVAVGADGRLPILHTSDQARRIGPDGRENLSLAAAFEIGRLLALSEPSVVAALLRFRKDGFETARRSVLLSLDPIVATWLASGGLARFGARAGARALSELATRERLGPSRPLIDPGWPVTGISDVDPARLLARGLGLSETAIGELFAEPRQAASLAAEPEAYAGFDALTRDAAGTFAGLSRGLGTVLSSLASRDRLGGLR